MENKLLPGKLPKVGTPRAVLSLGEGDTDNVRLTLPEKHAIAILKKDHSGVKDLFDAFEKAETPAAREKLIGQAVTTLKIHAVLEEEIFYPTVRAHVGSKVMNGADEEHHVARVLIAELDRNGKQNDHRDAKFIVLAESVRHHIGEEEGEMLPKAKELDIGFEALGQRMLDRKKELLAHGIQSDAEHAMVAKANGKANSPAAKAHRKAPVARKASAKVVGGRALKSRASSLR